MVVIITNTGTRVGGVMVATTTICIRVPPSTMARLQSESKRAIRVQELCVKQMACTSPVNQLAELVHEIKRRRSWGRGDSGGLGGGGVGLPNPSNCCSPGLRHVPTELELVLEAVGVLLAEVEQVRPACLQRTPPTSRLRAAYEPLVFSYEPLRAEGEEFGTQSLLMRLVAARTKKRAARTRLVGGS